MMGKLRGIAVMALTLVAGDAMASSVSFTADAVQTQPNQANEVGRMFMAEEGMRFEFQRQGHDVVQIVQPRAGLMRVLFPENKTYLEIHANALKGTLAERPESPCPPPAEAKCEHLRDETLDGVAVQAWRLTPATRSGTADPQPAFLWWDTTNKVVVRQRLSDASETRTVMRGHVTYQGRRVEQWETVHTGRDGKAVRSGRLHDPELNVNLREDYPGGAVRELRNIVLVRPDPKWFVVPTDYRKADTLEKRAPATAAPVQP